MEKESSRPSRRKRRKVMNQHPAEATSPGSAVATSSVGEVPIPAAAAADANPAPRGSISARSAGRANRALCQRKRGASDANHRDAMDGALSDLMWQLAHQLMDGELLESPEFYQARRSPSRPASAHNARMEGERQCTIVQRMLDKLATQPTSPHPAGESAQNVSASSGSPPPSCSC